MVDGHQGALFGEGGVGLDSVGIEFILGDQCHVLVISVSMVCPWSSR